MSVTVFLANQGFTLPATNLDDVRREAYFKNPRDAKNQLKPEEEKILLALGINKENAACLTPYLSRFFKLLPKCQTDANLTLARDCEIVQYVLWETLLAARARSDKQYKENQKTNKPLADISVAINSQIINDLKPVPLKLNDVDRLFTLLLKTEIPVETPVAPVAVTPTPVTPEAPTAEEPVAPEAPVEPVNKSIDDVFTLIVPAKLDENPQPFTPSPEGSQTGPEDAGSAITAPSVGSESTSRFSWFSKKKKSPFTSGSTQVSNQPKIKPEMEQQKSPFTSGSTQVSNEPERELGESINYQGESPFTKQSEQIPLTNEVEPPFSVVPTTDELYKQCEGKPRPEGRELHLNEFQRSLYFFYSIKYQKEINLGVPALEPAVETKFMNDWRKALKGKSNKTEAALKFLNVPKDKLSELNNIYKNFINGGERPSPIYAYGCEKVGETAAGYLERFYPTLERSERERTYLFQHADWPAGTGSDISLETPKSVNEVSVSIRDESRDKYFRSEGMNHLTILTTDDIDYSENNDFDYNIQGVHITDYLLVKDLFAKNKNYVLNISPQLIYLFYQERNIPRPTTDGESITINDAFLKNAFDGNHIPPQLSLDPVVQKQIDMAYYALCNAETIQDSKPYKFYSKPTSTKLPELIEWLENSNDKQYQTIKNLMGWAVPEKAPLEKSVLLDLFETVTNKKFTRKNKKTKNVNKTLKNQNRQNTTNQQPVNALTAARRAAVIPPQSMLEVSGTRKRNNKGMNNKTRRILAQAQPRPGSVAEQLGLPPSRPQQLETSTQASVQAREVRPGSVAAAADPATEKRRLQREIIDRSRRELLELQEASRQHNTNEPPLVLQEPQSAQAKPGLFDVFKTKKPAPQEAPSNIDPYYQQDNETPPPEPKEFKGTSTVPGATGLRRAPEEQALINARLNAMNAKTRRAAAARGRDKLRKGLKTRRLNNIRRRAQNLQRQEEPVEAPVPSAEERAQQEKNINEAKQRILERQTSDPAFKSKWKMMPDWRKHKFTEQLADRLAQKRMEAEAQAIINEARRQNEAIASLTTTEPTAEELAELEAL